MPSNFHEMCRLSEKKSSFFISLHISVKHNTLFLLRAELILESLMVLSWTTETETTSQESSSEMFVRDSW